MQRFQNQNKLIFSSGRNHYTDLLNGSKLIMSVAGADGEISETEWDVIYQFLTSVGGNLAILDEIKEFDFSNIDLDETIDEIDRNLYNIILYNAMKAARVDGLSNEEMEKSLELARSMEIPDNMCKAIEHLLNLEEELWQMRFNLLKPEINEAY